MQPKRSHLVLAIWAATAVGTFPVMGRANEVSSRTTPAPYDKFSLWSKGTRLRGANIHQRRVYVELDGDEFMGPGPLGPPLGQGDFDSLAKAGANLAVLSHPGLYDEKPPYALNQGVQDNLDRLLGLARKADLFAVIVARTGPGRSEFSLLRDEAGTWFDKSYINDDVWTDRAAQDAYVAMWRHTAARYRGNPVVVGYELMAEPNAEELLGLDEPGQFYPAHEGSSHDWNVLAARISSAIREVDPDTPILIGGLHYSGVRWLPYVKPTGDDRTVYTAHQYEPQTQYTHQAPDQDGRLVNSYPGRFDTNEDGVVRAFDKAWLTAFLGDIAAFQRDRRVPVAVTEFGVKRWQKGADSFLADELELLEKLGVNAAIWEWASSHKVLNDEVNDFNFRFGPNRKDKKETDSQLYRTIRQNWRKNAIRPSSLIPR